MFCMRCGKATDPGAAFCTSCGAAQPQPGKQSAVQFKGQGGELLPLYLKLVFFSIFTLGFYYFWGITNLRRYLWAQTDFAGETFRWLGTAEELLIGWLKALGIFIAISLMQQMLFWLLRGWLGALVGGLASAAAVLVLLGFAITGAWRYRMSRTTWRGLRFSFRGRYEEGVTVFIKGALLTILTLGLYTPYFMNDLRRFLVEHTGFGTMKFRYDGQGGDLFGKFVICLLLFFPTIGLSMLWYFGFAYRYYWNKTHMAEGDFVCDLDPVRYAWVVFSNNLLVIFTLGIGYAWASARIKRLLYGSLKIVNVPDLSHVLQQATEAGATGLEALGMLDDTGIDLGLGL